jgi:hypothetical protein
MHDQPRPAIVAALVEAIDSRAPGQTDWMTRALMRGVWPGGHADRSDPTALHWVRRWGPARVQETYSGDCSCTQGRCAVCN